MPCQPDARPLSGGQRDIRILIVEDHVPTGQAIEALLRGSLGAPPMRGRSLEVATAHDAESALERIAAEPPDLVVMDISLPGMNGIEATRRLRAIAPAMPVVIHSRNDSEVYRCMAAEAGVTAFVSKQRTVQDLVPSIRAILTESAAD